MSGVDDDEVAVAAMSPEDLRAVAASRRAAEADLRASARRYRSMAYEEGRAADQRGHEAVFLDQAAAALAVLQQARRELPALEAAAEGAVTAKRLADDRYRRAAGNLTRRQAEERRAGKQGTSPEQRDEAAVRVLRASRTVDEERAALAAGEAASVKADQALAAKLLEVGDLENVWAAAAWRAEHPGEAPRTSPIARGAVTAADMTEEERQLMGGLGLLAGLSRGESAPAKPDPAATLRDQGRFRVLGPGVIVPPRMS
jgi:hypothetical protein